MPILEFFHNRSRTFIVTTGVVLVFCLWTVDYRTGPDFSFVIFYLLPVFFVTWFAGRNAGIAVSLLSGLAWFTADLLAAEAVPSTLIQYSNLITKLGFFLILSSTISSLRISLERERELARTDYITTVANSRYFAELADAEIKRAGRYQHPFTVAYLDIDDFKKVNDEWGHSTGDALLAAVATTIRANIRSTDVIARLGGDEFAMLLPETGFEAAQIVVGKVHESLLLAMREREWPVTFSVGVVTFKNPPESVDSMIRTADRFMYSVKHAGKNSVLHKQVEYRET